MTSSREHIAHDQLLCWNCEEIVHISVSSCPYCNAALQHTKPSAPLSSSKITQLIPTQTTTAPQEDLSAQPVPQTGSSILSLLLLLGGSNILFLGILIALFSREGSFSLQWPAHHWPAYFGLGMAFTTFGLFTLQRVEK